MGIPLSNYVILNTFSLRSLVELKFEKYCKTKYKSPPQAPLGFYLDERIFSMRGRLLENYIKISPIQISSRGHF